MAVSGASSQSWRWEPDWRTSKVALFRLEASGDAILQHIRTTVVQQRGPSHTVIDSNASLSEVPGWVLAELQTIDYQPTEAIV